MWENEVCKVRQTDSHCHYFNMGLNHSKKPPSYPNPRENCKDYVARVCSTDYEFINTWVCKVYTSLPKEEIDLLAGQYAVQQRTPTPPQPPAQGGGVSVGGAPTSGASPQCFFGHATRSWITKSCFGNSWRLTSRWGFGRF